MSIWLLSAAWAGGIYINDILVDPASVAGTRLEKVAVSFDEEGSVRIDAPGYKVELVAPASPALASPAAVPPARYWMVTEDDGSRGHTVECWVNGKRAATAVSGQAQRILDVGPWLHPGSNTVVMKATSRAAGGGSFYVYLGTGRADDQGTVVMDDPVVQFGLGSSRDGPTEREFVLDVR